MEEPNSATEALKPLILSNGDHKSEDQSFQKSKASKAEQPEETERLVVLCIPLYAFPHGIQFTICTVGVMLFYLTFGYSQELLFQLPGFRPFGMFLTLIQFIVNALLSFLERAFRKERFMRIPLKTHCLIAFLSVSTMGLSNTSVGYLNYPTHVIFKSCTLLPILAGGVLIQGKKHDRFDLLSAIFMSIGLVCFMLTDVTVSPNFNTTGVTLIMLALLADAAIGNVQEKAMKTYSSSILEVIFFSNAIGIIYLTATLLVLNQLGPALNFCNQHKFETYGQGIIFSLLGYCGMQLVLTLVQISGAFVAAIVTNCRKGLTVVLSFILFAKPFSFQYVWAGLIVFLGIFFNVMGKNPDIKSWILLKLSTFIVRPFSDLLRCFLRPLSELLNCAFRRDPTRLKDAGTVIVQKI